MIIDLQDTTSNAIDKAMVDLREKFGQISLSRVLTLIIVTDAQHVENAIESAIFASHEHPCRVVVIVAGGRVRASRLDAQIRIGGDAGAGEILVLYTHGALIRNSQSVVMPLLLPDAPVVAWWPHEAPDVPGDDPVGRLAARRITDAASVADPMEAVTLRESSYRPGDTDLAWSRVTLWRAVLSAALDQESDQKVTSAQVVGGRSSASAVLLAGWLSLALGCPVDLVRKDAVDGLVGVRLDLASGPIVLDRAIDEDVALLATPGRSGRIVALPKRHDRDCLSEELRRLDPDEVYGEVLTEGIKQLDLSRRAARGAGRRAAVKAAARSAGTQRPSGKNTATRKGVVKKSSPGLDERIREADNHGVSGGGQLSQEAVDAELQSKSTPAERKASAAESAATEAVATATANERANRQDGARKRSTSAKPHRRDE